MVRWMGQTKESRVSGIVALPHPMLLCMALCTSFSSVRYPPWTCMLNIHLGFVLSHKYDLLKPFFGSGHRTICWFSWGSFFTWEWTCNLYLCVCVCVCVCPVIVLLQQVTWDSSTFPCLWAHWSSSSAPSQHHLGTFASLSLTSELMVRRKREELWSQTWIKCWLHDLVLLWDSGHVCVSPRVHVLNLISSTTVLGVGPSERWIGLENYVLTNGVMLLLWKLVPDKRVSLTPSALSHVCCLACPPTTMEWCNKKALTTCRPLTVDSQPPEL
jgi:hypothetical protein